MFLFVFFSGLSFICTKYFHRFSDCTSLACPHPRPLDECAHANFHTNTQGSFCCDQVQSVWSFQCDSVGCAPGTPCSLMGACNAHMSFAFKILRLWTDGSALRRCCTCVLHLHTSPAVSLRHIWSSSGTPNFLSNCHLSFLLQTF